MENNTAVRYGFTVQQVIDEGRVMQADIDTLASWLTTEKLPKLTQEQIVLFLLSCLNNKEATKTTIRAFVSVRNANPELFNDRRISRADIQQQLSYSFFCTFPERMPDGYSVIFVKLRNSDYSKFNFVVFVKLIFMTLDAAVYDHPSEGLVMLLDMKEMVLMHLTKIKLGVVKAFFQYLQEGLPVRLRNIHVLNLNSASLVSKIMVLIRPFAKKEVMDAIHFHPKSLDMEFFYKKCIPKQCLPKELGGDLPSTQALHEETLKKFTDLEPHFNAEEIQRRGVD